MSKVGTRTFYDVQRLRVSERRRALFPAEDAASENELGPMSPLSSDANSDEEEVCMRMSAGFNKPAPATPTTKYVCSVSSMSPLCLSPFTPSEASAATPNKVTPSDHNHKTPHDAVSTEAKLPKLSRKSLEGNSVSDAKLMYRKVKSDSKNSKVCTSLFPERDISLPAKSFYPKEGSNSRVVLPWKYTPTRSSLGNIPSNRARRGSRRKLGGINAGVRHSIRRPKHKKLSKEALLKTAEEILDNSPFNEFFGERKVTVNEEIPNDPVLKQYMSDLKEMQSRTNLIQPAKDRVPEKRQGSPLGENGSRKLMKLNDGQAVVQFDTSDLLDADDMLIPEANIANILENLEDKENVGNGVPSDDVLLSPTTQMCCDMKSGLALNSPKRNKNLSVVLESMASTNGQRIDNSSNKRLFPIFYPEHKPELAKACQSSRVGGKKLRVISKDQLLLDAGQKRFGLIQCNECDLIYHVADPEDERMHHDYHNGCHILRFYGWKNERVVANFPNNARIILVKPDDSKLWLKKVEGLTTFVNRDLGFYDMPLDISHSQVFLYIKSKQIVGCVIAEARMQAYRMISNGYPGVETCSRESYPVMCGVSRIWVAQNHRRQGIATALMDTLKRCFCQDVVLSNDDIALTAPTEAGRDFAIKYFKTPNFLICYV